MRRRMMKSKIHRATVTDADLHYVGSITVDLDLMAPMPTIDGKVDMKIPPGTQSGAVFRLRGKGVLAPSGQRGDLHVRVAVETPKNLSDRQRLALLELAGKLPPSTQPQKQQYAAALQQLEQDESSTALSPEKAGKR